MFEKLNSLDDLLLHEVQDMYHAEKQLVKTLPDVAEKAEIDLPLLAVEEQEPRIRDVGKRLLLRLAHSLSVVAVARRRRAADPPARDVPLQK